MCDLAHMTDDRWPIPKDINKIGFPFSCLKYRWGLTRTPWDGEDFSSFWHRLPGKSARSFFAELLLWSGPFGGSAEKKFFSGLISDIVRSLDNRVFFPTKTLQFIFSEIKDSAEKANVLSHIGCIMSNSRLYDEGSEDKQHLQKMALFLTSWLEQEPSDDGLVNLLAVIAASVQIDRLPNCLRKFILSDNPQTAGAAVVLQLAQRNIGFEEIQRITQEVLEKCSTDQQRIISAIRIYEQHLMDNPAGIAFLEKLLTTLPPLFIEARRNVMRILMELLSRRVAPLSDKQVWDKLCLPAGLFSLLSI